MDCKSAHLLMEFARPGSPELDAGEAEALRQHLAECGDCAALAAAERRADEHLGRAMRDVPVPDGLRQRLLTRLTAERKAWYRHRPVLGFGAAAAVLLIGWVGHLLWFNRLPAISNEYVRQLADRQRPTTAKEVAEAFKELRVEVTPPPRLNYRLLKSYDLSLFQQWHQVPHILLVAPAEGNRREATAHVYILSKRRFDLERTFQNVGQFLNGSHFTVESEFSDDEDKSFLYVMFYTGDSRAPFQLGGDKT